VKCSVFTLKLFSNTRTSVFFELIWGGERPFINWLVSLHLYIQYYKLLFNTLNLLTSLCNIHLLFSCVFYVIVRLEYYLVKPCGSIYFLFILLHYSGQSTSYFLLVSYLATPSVTSIFHFVCNLHFYVANRVIFIQSNSSYLFLSNQNNHYKTPISPSVHYYYFLGNLFCLWR